MHIHLLWRLTSLLALLLYALLVFGAVLLVLHNLWFALLLGLVAAMLLCAAWLMMTGAGSRLRFGQALAGMSALGLIVLLAAFFSEASQRRTVIALGLIALVYLVIVGLLRRAYWRERRQAGGAVHPPAHFKYPYLIINPKSGDGRAIKAGIDDLAREKGIVVMVTKRGDDIETLARKAVAQGADVLGISGGDGSIGAVVKVALQHELPVVVLPGGTRCHFARDLGLDPKRIVDSLAGFEGVERLIDVGVINGRTFLNNVSFGMYADIVDHPEYRDNKLEVSRTVVRELVSGERKPYPLRFHHQSQKFTSAVQVLVSVNEYQTFNLLELGHRIRLDGGVLQVTAITRLNGEMVRQLLASASTDAIRKQHKLKDFYQWTARAFTITGDGGSLVAGVDGERETYTTPVHVVIRPQALSVYVPAEGDRNRPHQALGLSMARRIWRVGVTGHAN